MNVKYYTAFQRVVHHIKQGHCVEPGADIERGAEALSVIFDIPYGPIREQLKEALK